MERALKFVSSSLDYFADAPAEVSCQGDPIYLVEWQGNSHQDWKNSIAVDDNANPEQVVSHLLKNPVNHFVQKNRDHFWPEVQYSLPIVKSPESYFDNGARGLAGAVGEYHKVRFTNPKDKPFLKDEVANFTQAIGSISVTQAVDIVVEELYMNAMIDAPREAQKRGYKTQKYDGENAAQVELYWSGPRLIVNCSDPFGALDVEKFLKRMDEVYSKGAGEAINLKGGGGAGLGCVMIFEQCLSLFLGVQQGHRTLVSCVIPVGMSNRQKTLARKSLHRIKI